MKKTFSILFAVACALGALAQSLVSGRVYPERDDDLAWENDKVAFRAYGPAIQKRGEKGFGYDLFLKRGTDQPVLEEMYAGQCSGSNWRKMAYLRSQGLNDQARAFERSFTYHVDHGHGLDCYAVGPTLGAGVTAIVKDGEILYPWCWDTCEILENGPDRFKAHLTYTPMAVGNDTVIEHRVITLEKGSHFNRTEITYEGLTQPQTIATGIVLRDGAPALANIERKYICYVDPTQGPDNGKLFVGAAFEQKPDSTDIVYAGGAKEPTYPGHLLAYHTYRPGDTYTYYWGYGWDRADVPSLDAFIALLNEVATKE